MSKLTRIEEEDLVRLYALKANQTGKELTETNQKIEDIQAGKRPYLENK